MGAAGAKEMVKLTLPSDDPADDPYGGPSMESVRETSPESDAHAISATAPTTDSTSTPPQSATVAEMDAGRNAQTYVLSRFFVGGTLGR